MTRNYIYILQVANAEGLLTALIAKHNLSLSVGDHISSIVPKMFPDSEIAEAYGCGCRIGGFGRYVQLRSPRSHTLLTGNSIR